MRDVIVSVIGSRMVVEEPAPSICTSTRAQVYLHAQRGWRWLERHGAGCRTLHFLRLAPTTAGLGPPNRRRRVAVNGSVVQNVSTSIGFSVRSETMS